MASQASHRTDISLRNVLIQKKIQRNNTEKCFHGIFHSTAKTEMPKKSNGSFEGCVDWCICMHVPADGLLYEPYPGVPVIFRCSVKLVHLRWAGLTADQEQASLLIGYVSDQETLQWDHCRFILQREWEAKRVLYRFSQTNCFTVSQLHGKVKYLVAK